jgi:hypothetical protein
MPPPCDGKSNDGTGKDFHWPMWNSGKDDVRHQPVYINQMMEERPSQKFTPEISRQIGASAFTDPMTAPGGKDAPLAQNVKQFYQPDSYKMCKSVNNERKQLFCDNNGNKEKYSGDLKLEPLGTHSSIPGRTDGNQTGNGAAQKRVYVPAGKKIFIS